MPEQPDLKVMPEQPDLREYKVTLVKMVLVFRLISMVKLLKVG